METPHLSLALAFGLVYVPLLARALAPEAAWAPRARQAYAAAAIAYPGFAAATLLALAAGADARRTTVLCIGYVIARALHIPAAILDLGFMRRALWGLSLVLIFALFVLPALT